MGTCECGGPCSHPLRDSPCPHGRRGLLTIGRENPWLGLARDLPQKCLLRACKIERVERDRSATTSGMGVAGLAALNSWATAGFQTSTSCSMLYYMLGHELQAAHALPHTCAAPGHRRGRQGPGVGRCSFFSCPWPSLSLTQASAVRRKVVQSTHESP